MLRRDPMSGANLLSGDGFEEQLGWMKYQTVRPLIAEVRYRDQAGRHRGRRIADGARSVGALDADKFAYYNREGKTTIAV